MPVEPVDVGDLSDDITPSHADDNVGRAINMMDNIEERRARYAAWWDGYAPSGHSPIRRTRPAVRQENSLRRRGPLGPRSTPEVAWPTRSRST
jgi:hypothetical protein